MFSTLLALFDPDSDTADALWGIATLIFLIVGIISIAVNRPAKFGWLQGAAWIGAAFVSFGLMFLV